MSTAVATLVLLAAGTYALKASGPLMLHGRSLPSLVQRAAALLPAALLAALVITSTASAQRSIVVDARLPALVVAALLLWLRAPFVIVVLGAALTAAVVRAVL